MRKIGFTREIANLEEKIMKYIKLEIEELEKTVIGAGGRIWIDSIRVEITPYQSRKIREMEIHISWIGEEGGLLGCGGDFFFDPPF